MSLVNDFQVIKFLSFNYDSDTESKALEVEKTSQKGKQVVELCKKLGSPTSINPVDITVDKY
jgi:hypothetical protein